jgi:hypothetical protein
LRSRMSTLGGDRPMLPNSFPLENSTVSRKWIGRSFYFFDGTNNPFFLINSVLS